MKNIPRKCVMSAVLMSSETYVVLEKTEVTAAAESRMVPAYI